MSKSEYYEPMLFKGEKPYPQIVEDAMEILSLLFKAEMMMTRVDRVRFNSWAIMLIQEVIKQFWLAYDFPEDRREHIKQLCAYAGLFMLTMRIIAERNVIHIRCKHESDSPDTVKIKLMQAMGRMDEGITKWKKSLEKTWNKGTSGIIE